MNKLTSDAIEVVNRNALVTVALNQGYNAYLPVYDNGIDLILHNEATGDTRLVQLKGRWTINQKYLRRNIWIAFPDRGNWGAPQGLSYGQRQSEQMVNKGLSVAAKYIKFRGFVRLDELEVTGSPLVMFHPRSS